MREEPIDETGMDLRRLKSRDQTAVERWFLEYVDSLYTFAFYRVGKDPNLAADVVQDTFMAALKKINFYEPERGSMFAWLTYTARNCIRRALKQKRQYAHCIDRWEAVDRELVKAYDRLDETPLSGDLLERQETAELVQVTLSNMPFKYSRLLKRHYCQQQSLRQIADSDGLTEGAVKSLLHRARLAFKTAFLTLAKTCVPISWKGSVS